MSRKKKKRPAGTGSHGKQVYKASEPSKTKGDVSWMKEKYVRKEEAAPVQPPEPAAEPALGQQPAPQPEQKPEGELLPEAPQQESRKSKEGQSAPPDGGSAEASPAPKAEEKAQAPEPDGEAAEVQPAEEQPAGELAPAEPEEQALAEAEGPALTPEEQAEERRRIAEMTRTVQVSLSQILDALPDAGEPLPEEPEEAEELSFEQRVGRTVGSGLTGFAKWLLLVLVFVAVIGGGGLIWLYSSATPDMIPTLSVSFNGEPLEPAAYRWHVPVVSNLIKRTYAKTLSKEPQQISGTVEAAAPAISVSPNTYASRLTIADETGQEVFSGTLADYRSQTFTSNGTYHAVLELNTESNAAFNGAVVTGGQTYEFTFVVNIKPSVRLNTQSVRQGGVAAVRLTGILGSAVPEISTDLCDTAFVQGSTGWVAYLPVGIGQKPGAYSITVKANGYTQQLTLNVNEAADSYRDYASRSELVTPYLALEETPAKVTKALQNSTDSILWGEKGFVQPFLTNIAVTLPYGTTEYVGRNATQRQIGTGSGRTSTNVVLGCTAGKDFISPAAGRVVLAETLDGTAGSTIVIDHGAGVMSVFYRLGSIGVKVGQTVRQGEKIGTTAKAMIGEVRIHGVPVEPLAIWRNECDAIKYY